MFRAFAGERTEADLALETAADMAARLGERGVEATARAHVGYWRALLGDDRALGNLSDGLCLARSIDDGPAGTVIAINLSHALVHLGRFREAAELYDEGAAFAERHGFADTRGLVFAGNVLEALEALGRWETAGAVMDKIRSRLSPDTVHRWASAFLGWTQIQIHRGQYAEVASSYHRGLEMWQTGYYSGDQLPAGSGLIELAAAGAVPPVEPATVEMWLDGLGPDQAPRGARLVATAARHLVPPATSVEHGRMVETVRDWIGRLRRTAAEYVQTPPVLDAWLAEAEAEVAEATGNPVPDRWAHLVSVWEELGCRFFAARARYRQADALLRGRGGRLASDRAEATRLLGAAGRTAAELGAEPLDRDIADLARRARLRLGDDSAEAPPAPVAPSPFGLTDRELDVLRLVNEGRSNGEIGTELFISTKTASVHVSNILRKLGASNRIEAAAIARRHRFLGR
jgi:DNA-binding CsgD family transcriptional regulator